MKVLLQARSLAIERFWGRSKRKRMRRDLGCTLILKRRIYDLIRTMRLIFD